MPEPTKPEADPPKPASTAPENENESEAGDFISRNVLEKDTVFFEG